MRATYKSSYFKNGKKIDVYAVTGTASEVQDYMVVTAARQNKVPDDLSKDEKGNPLFHYPRSFAFNNGHTPKAVYTLIKNQAGDRYLIDNSADEAARWARISKLQEQSVADRLADIEVGGSQVQNPTVSKPAPKPATQPENHDVLSEMGAAVESIAEGTETLATS